MKKLMMILLSSLLFISNSSAGPVIVWPSDMSHEKIEVSEILGSWWVFSDNTFAEIYIQKTENQNFIHFTLIGKNSRIMNSGYLEVASDNFFGVIQSFHSGDQTRALLYRGPLGFRIQFVESDKIKFFDLLR